MSTTPDLTADAEFPAKAWNDTARQGLSSQQAGDLGGSNTEWLRAIIRQQFNLLDASDASCAWPIPGLSGRRLSLQGQFPKQMDSLFVSERASCSALKKRSVGAADLR